MKIRALKFLEKPVGTDPARIELEIGPDSPAALVEELPAVYVIQVSDLDHVLSLKEHIVDRGIKHKAKGLSKILLGRKKIPVIDGNFSDAGQLRRSIRTLLANAASRNERNLYIVGTEPSIFETLWKQAGKAGGKEAPRTAERPAPPVTPAKDSDDSGEITERMLAVLGDCEVPVDLTQRFKGSSPEAHLVRRFIVRAALSDVRVLIQGDTGTGKEIVARAIHKLSRRNGKPFIPVNCSGIPRDLLESELFGHEKGSFTGATSRKEGLWEVANGGTLFLDEIGDLPLEQQAKILRAVEEREIRPVGGREPTKVDVRIIAATNRDLYAMVVAGQFREDLYYRLREFLIRTPALRDRPEDIPLLAQHVWTKIVKDGKKTLPKDILNALQSYGWMGNVRELRTVLTNLHALFGEENLSAERLKTIFQFYGQTLVLPETGEPSPTLGHKWVEGLSHLRRTDEIINACQASLRPITEQHRTDSESVATVRASLRLRLHELETLCLYPLLFQSEALFSMVNLFKGKIAYLQSLLQKDTDGAVKFWETEGSGVLNHVQGALSEEINRLLSSAA